MGWMMEQRFEFGPFVFDGKRRLLLKHGSPVAIGQRGLALLEALLAAGGRTVSKSELLDAVWQTENIGESNLSVQIAALRKCLGKSKSGEEWIATVQRVGYQFVNPGREKQGPLNLGILARPEAPGDKPSIAVLPFTNMSSDPDQEFFADGMTEDIITALSRIRELFVISRNSSFAYKGRAVRLEDVAQELGVKFLLEGSVRVASNRVRVTAQLVDGHSGGHIWAERFDGEREDIFAVQDEITRSIALAIQVKLTYGELARLWEGQTKNLRAWEKMARGRDHFLCFDVINNREAQRVLKEALEIDPNYTGAMIQLGLCYWWQARYNASVDKESSLQLSEQQVERALGIDPNMGSAYMLRGGNAFLRDRHEEAMAFCEKAIELAPSDSWALAFLGLVCIYGGKSERAVAVLKTALRLSPHPPNWYIESFAMAHLWIGDLAAAQEAAEENFRLEPDDQDAHMILATVYGFQRREDDAIRIISELKKKFPAYGLRNITLSERYLEREKLDKVIAVLRRAGLPE
jgi:TolB-like protein/Tfp pilus assembly protein PilF